MRLAWIVVVAAVAAGCSPEPARTDNSEIDIDIERAIAEMPGLTEKCIRALREKGTRLDIPTDQCFQTTAPRRWRGLWLNEFENSKFCPEPAASCPFHEQGGIWLTGATGGGDGSLHRVEFIGRRTLYPGPHGHLGMFEHELFVDRMIAIEEVEAE